LPLWKWLVYMNTLFWRIFPRIHGSLFFVALFCLFVRGSGKFHTPVIALIVFILW
jgi:hypothetical protein